MMSGFVVACGEPRRDELKNMFEKIGHRGPYASGRWENKRVMMAQNYLKADVGGDPVHPDQVPVSEAGNGEVRICYDGQIGTRPQVDQGGGLQDGPFGEERLLLHLYEQHGSSMAQYLDDAVFSFVISNGREIFAARDLLGIKTLFFGWKDHTLYLTSELKSLVEVTDDVHEFPPGHTMDRTGRLSRFAELPAAPPETLQRDQGTIIEDIQTIIRESIRSRVDFRVPTAGLLSGGMDSSVISYLAGDLYKERFGKDARLKTFAIGVGESSDIQNARIMAQHTGSDHSELIVDLDQVLNVLPEVIYYLESFDPSLVRSSASNFLISRYAKQQGYEVLLSGEGGDEIFCGYLYLKDCAPEELFARQMECLGFLHNNASLRLDRMNQCHSVRVVAPLISGELFRYALAIPPEYKQKPEGDEKIEKWIFRKAFEPFLPDTIAWRLKQEFSQGSGLAELLPAHFEDIITDEDLAGAQSKFPIVRSKEELSYFRIFTEHFGTGKAVETVGQWVST
jgi:asparagine synthase (glutamine-hydrolysing)